MKIYVYMDVNVYIYAHMKVCVYALICVCVSIVWGMCTYMQALPFVCMCMETRGGCHMSCSSTFHLTLDKASH